MTFFASQATGCSSAAADGITSVPAAEFDKDIKTDSVQLLDVRTPQEFAQGHIKGAININVQSADFCQAAEQALEKGATVLVYCRSGRRSLDAADQLAKRGYRVINLKGGIIEWEDEGLPVTAN